MGRSPRHRPLATPILRRDARSSPPPPPSAWTNGLELMAVRGKPRPPDRRLRRLERLQGPEEMHEIPGLGRLQLIGERWHRRAVESRHENAIQVLVGGPAHEARAGLEVVRTDGIVLVVRQCLCGGAVAVPCPPMALPAFHALVQLPPVQNALNRRCGLGGNRHPGPPPPPPPARRERLVVWR